MALGFISKSPNRPKVFKYPFLVDLDCIIMGFLTICLTLINNDKMANGDSCFPLFFNALNLDQASTLRFFLPILRKMTQIENPKNMDISKNLYMLKNKSYSIFKEIWVYLMELDYRKEVTRCQRQWHFNSSFLSHIVGKPIYIITSSL